MPTLLHLDSSADLHHSRSRAITALFADAWRRGGPGHTVTYRDLHRDPLPHLADPEQHWARTFRQPGADVPPAADAVQQEILDELLGADVLLIGVPTYNYAPPSTLKAWLDHIHVPGVTAPLDTDTQPLAGRRAVLVNSSGAIYDAGTPAATWNHAVAPLQIVLGESLGMVVEVISCTRTLADRVPALAAEAAQAQLEFNQACARAADLGRQLAIGR